MERKQKCMSYKLSITKAIEEHGLTILEVTKKTGLSIKAILRFENKNDCNFSDLFVLSQAIDCSIEELYEHVDSCEVVNKPKKLVNREKRIKQRIDIYTILSKHIPDELNFVSQSLGYDGPETANRIWSGRLSARAIARINRKAESDTYMDGVLAKVNDIKLGISAYTIEEYSNGK